MEIKDIENRLAGFKEEREIQSGKVEKARESFERSRDKLAKEQSKLKQIDEKIDNMECYLIKYKLRTVGDEGEVSFDEILEVYKQYKNKEMRKDV